MKTKTMALLLFMIFLSCDYSYANRDENMEPAKGFFLPKGDVAAGRTAFKELKCNTCHNVEGDSEFSAGSGMGPGLGVKQADYASGWLANSLVSPSHTIALGSEEPGENVQSKMGDFKDKMTVRQLIDLVTYIKSLNTEDKTLEEESDNQKKAG